MSGEHQTSVLRRAFLLAFIGAVSLPSLARSQVPNGNVGPGQVTQIVGQVVDRRSAEPIPAARITLVRASDGAPAWSGVSDGRGSFRTPSLPLGDYQIEVEAAPFVSLSQPVILRDGGALDLRVQMVGVDYELDPVVAVARRMDRLESAGFYRRMEQGNGDFITRADIEARGPTEPSDLLRQIPSVVLEGYGSPAGPRIYLRRMVGELPARLLNPDFLNPSDDDDNANGCVPIIVKDGVPSLFNDDWGVDNLYNPEDLEAIEVHRGAFIPAQYKGLTDCGVLMIWTRDPMNVEGGGWFPSWKKLGLLGGLVGMSIVLTQH